MTIFHRAPAGLVASGVFILGLFCAAATVTHAAPVNNPVMLINLKTGKCLTIAVREDELVAIQIDKRDQVTVTQERSQAGFQHEPEAGTGSQIHHPAAGRCSGRPACRGRTAGSSCCSSGR